MRLAGYVASIWSLMYIPIHIYWAFGGMALVPGAWKEEEMWKAVNWGASAMLLVAAILAFSLTHPLGRSIPRRLMIVMGWTACLLPFIHAVYGYVTKGLLLAGIIPLEFFDFSAWATLNVNYLILIDLLLFEPWFLIEGILFGLATLYYQSEIKKVMEQQV